jgi:hypothetical protein
MMNGCDFFSEIGLTFLSKVCGAWTWGFDLTTSVHSVNGLG